MENNFDQLVYGLSRSSLENDVLPQIILILNQQTDQSFESLLILERWAWHLLSQDSLQWINEIYYQEFFHALASFNKNLIFTCDQIETDTKASLLISETIDQLNRIFKHIEQSKDENNNPFIAIINLWFDNHSYFLLRDNPKDGILAIVDHIGQYFVQNYVMTKQFKICLSQLQQHQTEEFIFTDKMLFYMKTCPFYLYAYLGVKLHDFYHTANEIVLNISDDYLQIIHIHSHTVALWTNELFSCITHLTAFIAACFWSDEQEEVQMKKLFPTEQILCEHVKDLIRIITHRSFYEQIKPQRLNNETILLGSILMILLVIVKTQNINWFFRLNTEIHEIILTMAEISVNDKICLESHAILGIILTDEQLKDLKTADNMAGFFFNVLEQAWQHTSKMYKHTPLLYMLRAFRNLSKNDSLQQKTADLKKLPLFIDMSDQYIIVYDILWTLSFNQDIQQQLRSNSSFMSKLYHLAKESNNEQMRKVLYGIIWNLEINHEELPTSRTTDGKTFDIMISYSHKDKVLCKQIYDELIKVGYRVWIDFDQLYGNVMDTMAQGIDRSHTIIICMSEEYRRSNYCRAEAQYAFQRQLKIVPVLLQKHYKPDGWLLFLIGQLLYIDFIKHEFTRATKMLFKELRVTDITEISVAPVRPKEDIDVASAALSIPSLYPQNILEWTETHVQNWLGEHKLIQMSRLLADSDGRSLVYLNKYMKHGELRYILNSLQEDSLRRTHQTLSFIELSRFQSLMDQQYPDE